MYCPQCSAENRSKQRYCRHCGLPLSGVRSAIEGKTDEAITKYRKGGDLLVVGLIVLSISAVNVLFNLVMSSEARSVGAMVILILGLLISFPIIVTGLTRVALAERLLKAKDQPEPLTNNNHEETEPQLRAAPITDQLMQEFSSRGSVTEEATLKLRPPKPQR